MTIHRKALEEHFLIVPLVLRLSKPTDMTIDWKALEEHFLMVSTLTFAGPDETDVGGCVFPSLASNRPSRFEATEYSYYI
jgi:hypothetical protein